MLSAAASSASMISAENTSRRVSFVAGRREALPRRSPARGPRGSLAARGRRGEVVGDRKQRGEVGGYDLSAVVHDLALRRRCGSLEAQGVSDALDDELQHGGAGLVAIE